MIRRIALLIYQIWYHIFFNRCHIELKLISKGGSTLIFFGKIKRKGKVVPGDIYLVAMERDLGLMTQPITVDGFLYIHSDYISIYEVNTKQHLPGIFVGDRFQLLTVDDWDRNIPKKEAIFNFTNKFILRRFQ